MNKIHHGFRWTPIHCFLLLAPLLLWPGITSRAHQDTETHARLSVASFLFLDQTYPADGALFSTFARGLARQGSINEDDDPLYFNHFFNPKTGATIDVPFYDEQTAPQRASGLWSMSIQQYRGGQTNNAFDNLGHVLHLLQDMTSPAHVHLDVHGGGLYCEGDNDDFENWGYCPHYGLNAILQYVAYTDVDNSQILPPLGIGLERIFANQPQVLPGGANTAYSYVSTLADRVYDFTSFYVILKDTSDPFNLDEGQGELKLMFPSLKEWGGGGWYFEDSLGYNNWSQGECGGNLDQGWWLMDHGCIASGCGFGCTRDEGYAYIENVGGGDWNNPAIPDALRPARYDRPWFQKRYGSIINIGAGNVTMLRIYGDVLYPAAVAYGAGLLQAFLDEAIMPKPITARPTQLTDASAQLNGQVHPAGEVASAWFEWGPGANYGYVTAVQDAGAGNNPTNLSARIDGLMADTVYQCRIVSSNRFGIRHGTSQTFRTAPLGVTSGTIPNPSFEANSFTVLPGYISGNGPITGWTTTDPARAGLNPASGSPFADNGATPHGNNVAFIQNGPNSSLSTVISNLTIGQTYKVTFRVNARSSFGGTPNLKVSIDGLNILSTAVTPVGGSNPYKYFAFDFTAAAASQTMTLRNDASGDHTVLLDDFSIGVRDSGWSYAAWNDDASSGVSNDRFYTHAYSFGSANGATINGIVFTGIPGGNPSQNNRFFTVGLPNASNNDLNNVTGAGSSQLARDFLWGGNEQSITIDGLTAGKSYVATIYSVAFENGVRLATFSVGNDCLTVNQDQFGDNNGIRVSYSFAANSSSITLTYVPIQTTYTFHTYGFSVYEVPPPVVIIASEVPQPGQFRLRVVGPHAAYEVQRSLNLSNWTTRGFGIAVGAGSFEFTDTGASAARAFYRVRSAFPAGLVSWWRGEDNYLDSFGPNHGSALSNAGPTFVTGQRGRALSFNGTTEAMFIGKAPIPVPWTACFWVKREDAAEPSAALLTDSVSGLKLEQWQFSRRVGFTAFGIADYSFNFITPANTWTHLTFVGEPGGTILYVNGTARETNVAAINLPMNILGARETGTDYFKGQLDETVLFNRVLSPTEVRQVFNVTRGP
jgi:concanavalin A-like lectin/glucanase superfamily protein/hapalindole biogenesis HpiC1 cyclase-like protein